MKTKTKRGQRRTRNQRVVNRGFIVTDYNKSNLFTAGKPYKIIEIEPGGYITAEYDKTHIAEDFFCSPVGRPCAHLDGKGHWRYLTK